MVYMTVGLLLTGCSSSSLDTSPVIATFEGQTLTLLALQERLPLTEGLDSATKAQEVIRTWKLEVLMAEEGKARATETQKATILRRLQNTENRLYQQIWEDAIAGQITDSSVTRTELEAYYKAHLEQFTAQTNLYNYYYVITNNKDTPELRQRLPSDTPEDVKKVVDWCRTEARDFKKQDAYLDISAIKALEKQAGPYVDFATLPPKSPVKVISRKDGATEWLYFFYMKDYVPKGKYIPLDGILDQVRSAYLAELRLEHISQARQTLSKAKGL
jgi:hypothetical protein